MLFNIHFDSRRDRQVYSDLISYEEFHRAATRGHHHRDDYRPFGLSVDADDAQTKLKELRRFLWKVLYGRLGR